MTPQIRALTAICIFLAGLSSCSYRATLSTRPAYTHVPLFNIPEDFPQEAYIDSAFYEVIPARLYTPPLEIRDSFSNLEKHTVGIPDKDLFARRHELIVNLTDFEKGAFYFPLPGARLLSKFGYRNGKMHNGIDLKINRRDTVIATFDGIVRMAGWSRGYGNVIVIRHYNGLETVYAHNSKHLIRPGDHVKAGTPIAISGETGRASTDHVHFEIRVNGKPVDPSLVINLDTQTLHPKRLVFTPDEKGKIKVESV